MKRGPQIDNSRAQISGRVPSYYVRCSTLCRHQPTLVFGAWERIPTVTSVRTVATITHVLSVWTTSLVYSISDAQVAPWLGINIIGPLVRYGTEPIWPTTTHQHTTKQCYAGRTEEAPAHNDGLLQEESDASELQAKRRVVVQTHLRPNSLMWSQKQEYYSYHSYRAYCPVTWEENC